MSIIRNFYKIKPPSGLVNWDLSSAVLVGSGTLTGAGYSMFFSPDGLNLYSAKRASSISQWILTTPWDSSDFNNRAADASGSFFLTAGNFIKGCTWSTDGTKFFIVSYTNDEVTSYDASAAPWDLAALTGGGTLDGVADISAQAGDVQGIWFREDGLKMYLSDSNPHFEYDLSTAWDITTLSYTGNILAGQNAVALSTAGGTAFSVRTSSTVRQYELSPDWSFAGETIGFDLTVGLSLDGLYVSPDGTKMFVSSGISNTWEEYSMTPIPA